jgi:hypothetical protein
MPAADQADTVARKTLETPCDLWLRRKEDESMLIERPDVAKLLAVAGCLLSMGVIVSILIRGTLPPL